MNAYTLGKPPEEQNFKITRAYSTSTKKQKQNNA